MKIITFDPKERYLSRAREYVAHPSRILAERERSTRVLLTALRHAHYGLRQDILLILGAVAKEETAPPLADIMLDPCEPEDLRDQAAIHLSVLLPFLDAPHPIVKRMISRLDRSSTEDKTRIILALGWEGNFAATATITSCLDHEDQEVRDMAVAALCAIGDPRVAGILVRHLTTCPEYHKPALLYHLWRYAELDPGIAETIRTELKCCGTGVRKGLLDLLEKTGTEEDQAETGILMAFLDDPEPAIRAIALERLGGDGRLTCAEILPFLDDPSMDVKRAALRALQRRQLGQ